MSRRPGRPSGGAPASIHDLVMVKEEGLARRPLLRRPRAALRARPVPRARRHARRPWRPRPRPSWATSATATFAVDHLAPGPVSLSRDGTARGAAAHGEQDASGWVADRLEPELGLELELHHRGTGPHRDAPGPRARRSTSWAAAATRRPGTTWPASGPRTTAPARRPEITAIGFGNDWVGVAVEAATASRRRTPGGARSRPSPTPNRASSASTRAARLLVSWPVHLGPGRDAPVRGPPGRDGGAGPGRGRGHRPGVRRRSPQPGVAPP